MNFIGFKEEVASFDEFVEMCLSATERPEPEDTQAVRIRTDPEDTSTKIIEYFVLEGTIPMWFPIDLRSAKK